MTAWPIRPLERKATLAATIAESLPEARSASELTKWCREVGAWAEEMPAAPRSSVGVSRVEVPTEAELDAEYLRVRELERKLCELEDQVVDLLAVELEVIKGLRRAGIPLPEAASTAEVLAILRQANEGT